MDSSDNYSIHIVGVGLDGKTGAGDRLPHLWQAAHWLASSDRHLRHFPAFTGEVLGLEDFAAAIATLQQRVTQTPDAIALVLASGDPLFFGLGRLLLAKFPAERLFFYPHVSSMQLAFSRVKVPWQDACLLSVHGRSLDALLAAARRGEEKIAALTDDRNGPVAIARALLALDLPQRYRVWVCENLGDLEEKVRSFALEALAATEIKFASLNVTVLLREEIGFTIETLPAIGIPDRLFASFRDRPGLMTKQEVRVLALAELALQPGQTIWDVGAGTGSVSVEIARLCPSARVWAVEKTAAGVVLVAENCRRFATQNVEVRCGRAPEILEALPAPDRVFVGGSGGALAEILESCDRRLKPGGIVLLALATQERLAEAIAWLRDRQKPYRILQANLARSVPVADLTRLAPLNPVTLVRSSLGR